MKTLPPLPPEMVEKIINDVNSTITLDMKDIEFDEDFMPIVYENEPYKEDTDLKTFVTDYVTGLRYLMDDFVKTKDIRYFDAVCSLMPTEMFLHYKGLLDANKELETQKPTEIEVIVDEENK